MKAQEKACADLSLEHRKSLDVRVQDAGCRFGRIMSWSLNQSACHPGFNQTWSFTAWKFKANLSRRKIVGFPCQDVMSYAGMLFKMNFYKLENPSGG